MATLRYKGKVYIGTPRAIGDVIAIELLWKYTIDDAEHYQLVAELWALDSYGSPPINIEERKN
jgi:hypothetical protein